MVTASALVHPRVPVASAGTRRRLCLVTLILGLVASCTPKEAPPPPAPENPQEQPATTSDAGTIAPKGPGITVTLTQTRKLQLVEWIWKPGKPGDIGLDGALTARITNTSKDSLVIKRLEIHGLLFSDVATGTRHLVINPSQCMRDFAQPADPVIQLDPGQSHEYTIDSWGSAGSMWQAPPAGTYHLTYRTLPGDQKTRPVPEDPGSIAVLNNCEQTLHSTEYWIGATPSSPLEIVLETPIPKQIQQ